MKLKYYLRGMGIGIIVTTIILAISFSQREVEISDEQVMVRAAALGMVMPEEVQETDTASTEVETETQTQTMMEDMPTTEMPADGGEAEVQQTEALEGDASEETPEEQPTEVDMPTTGTYRLVIKKGDVCRVVCEDLQENGVVADAEALRKHLFALGYANSISIGEYDVPYGLTMEEVAQIIVAGPIEE